jgi:DNA-binding NarL/FixJ family response regulator
LETSSIRVLLVDDYEPFRGAVVSRLEKQPHLRIIAEASDGLEAVQMAKELQPDLIVLDIGLPKLNGIEAALQIRELSPKSKILFVSQETSTDVVQGALATGAMGYVVKADTGSELITAVNAVLHDEVFVGSRFASQLFSEASHSQTSEGVGNDLVYLPKHRTMETSLRHEVGFYSDDASFLGHLTEFIGAALESGDAAVVVATESHRNSLLPRLQARGLDIGAAIEEGRYIAVDAADALSMFMVNGMPDPGRFLELLDDLIKTATEAVKGEHARVSVFGECVHLLWTQGNTEAAIQMEKLGNKLTKIHAVDILCGYSLGSVEVGMNNHLFQRICAEHSAVYSR